MTENEVLNTTCPTKLLGLERAIELAKEEYDRRYKDKMKGKSFGALACTVIDCPDIQVDFAHGDDLDEVEEMDEDEG